MAELLSILLWLRHLQRLTISFKFFKMGFSMGSAKELYRTLGKKEKKMGLFRNCICQAWPSSSPAGESSPRLATGQPAWCYRSPEFSRKWHVGVAHLGVTVLELQDRVTKAIAGQDDDTGEVDPREKQISSSCVLAVERKSARLPRPGQGWDSSFLDYP